MAPQAVDAVILGAGSAGERAAQLLAEAGRDVVVVERRLVGGECPYFACIPSKAMLISAAARAALTSAVEVSAISGPIMLQSADEAWLRAVRRRDQIADHHDDSAHEKALREAGVRLIRGAGVITGAHTMTVEGDDRATLSFDHLILATGSRPVIPDLPGLREAHPWTFEDAWTTRRRPKSLLIMGGGAVGCEIAQTFARFGTVVTLVEQETVGAGLEPEIAEDLADILRTDGVEVREHTGVDSVKPSDGLVSATIDGQAQDFEQMVVATGMTPRVDDIGLDALGLDSDGIDSHGIEVDGRGRLAGHDNVWAIGDVTDIAPFTHTANYQAAVVADNILGRDQTADYRAIPSAIYTAPSIAATGMTRQQARDSGVDVASTVFDLGDTARAAVGQDSAGRLVLVADKSTKTLVGASLVAPSAAESISELSLAIRAKIDLDVLADVVHPFPTWTEGFGPAIQTLIQQLAS